MCWPCDHWRACARYLRKSFGSEIWRAVSVYLRKSFAFPEAGPLTAAVPPAAEPQTNSEAAEKPSFSANRAAKPLGVFDTTFRK